MPKQLLVSAGHATEMPKESGQEALSEPHRIYATAQELEQEEIALLTKALMDGIKHPLQDSNISRAENSRR